MNDDTLRDPTARARAVVLERDWRRFCHYQGPVSVKVASYQGELFVLLETPNGQVLAGKSEGEEAADIVARLVEGIATEEEGQA